jgi:hypothetical protein
MRDFTVTRLVVTDDAGTLTPVNFTVLAVNAAAAIRFADKAKSAFETARGFAPAVRYPSSASEHLTHRPVVIGTLN